MNDRKGREHLTDKHDCEHDHHHHCDHDHGHDPHDHHPHDHHGQEAVSVTLHEGAVVGTVRISIQGPLDKAIEDSKKRIDKIAATVEREGGFIGHIKGIVQELGRACRLSLVEAGKEMDIQEIALAEKVWLECVFIVFHIGEHQLRELLEKEFQEPSAHS